MTDEQWLWLYVNRIIDTDEALEKMCPKCRDEVTSGRHCTRCGKVLQHEESMVNPNFDKSRFDRLSAECDSPNPTFSEEAYNRLKDGGNNGGGQEEN